MHLLADAADQYTTLLIETSLWAWGSDHVPYLDHGIPALLAIESDYSDYPYYHTTDDLPYHLSVTMGEEILKMSVAAMAVLAGSRTSQVFEDGFESGDLSRWSAALPNGYGVVDRIAVGTGPAAAASRGIQAAAPSLTRAGRHGARPARGEP